MRKVRLAWQLLTHLGPGWVAFRVRYALEGRMWLLLRRTPMRPWTSFGVSRLRLPAFVAPDGVGEGVVARADAILRGSYTIFSVRQVECGFPPVWNRSAVDASCAPLDHHWTRVSDFGFGDIKNIWELSRFPWAFDLARACEATGEERFARACTQLLADWMEKNPPNRGPNWKCGQEAALRLFAVAFAFGVIDRVHPLSVHVREELARFVQVTGARIEANLQYALSQSNNHGVSECAGLATAALLLPEGPDSARWLAKGMRHLRAQLDALVYPDGAFSQHSTNYHRVMLDDVLWLVALLRASNASVPDWLHAASSRALAWLDAATDAASGGTHRTGSDDGARILPLCEGAYGDFRPTVQAGHVLLHGVRRYPEGPWDEQARRLAAGVDVAALPLRTGDASGAFEALDGGWIFLRQGASHLLFRVPARFIHRPCNADMGQVSLRWRGLEMLMDPGTHSYNAQGRFAGAFKSAMVHNVAMVDGVEPLRKASRFLYLPWPVSRLEKLDGAYRYHVGTTEAVPARWTRTLATSGAQWEVEDTHEATDGKPHSVRVHWLLPDFPARLDEVGCRLEMDTPAGTFAIGWEASRPVSAMLVRASHDSETGWYAPGYGQVARACSLVLTYTLEGKATLATRFPKD